MRLVTLGGLGLEPGDFSDPQPLLVLAFIALEGKRSRGELKELFWPHQRDKTKRSKSLSEVVRRLKRADPHLLEPGRGALVSYVGVDALSFQAEVAEGRYEAALKLYGGTFLRGLERKRLYLGEELREWLGGKRAELQTGFVRALLALADEALRRAEPTAARGRVLQALALPEEVAPPSAQALVRMHDLLLAAGFGDEAEQVGERARHLHGSSLTPLRDVGLPTMDPNFIGREAELGELAKHFGAAKRLVTVTGLAGMGKTSLARAFARQAFPYFDGAHFVSLAPLAPDATPQDLWRSLAEVLGLPSSPERLTEHLRGRALLLIFDNFEPHLALRPVVTELSRRCPYVGILVTSRERLGLEDEHVLRLGGLSLPQRVDTLTELNRADAGRLLLAEAQRHAFTPRDDDAPALAELCRQTAGVPLALKLAAGWLPSLPLNELVTQLGKRLSLLGSDAGASVAAAFDGSLERLEPEARTLFSRLGVFEGGFGFGAAEAVVGARPQTLKRLVDSSLLEFDGHRYSLHPLISRYLDERFEATDALKAEHARYFLAALGAVTSDSQHEKDHAVETLREDLGNLTVAWHWAVRQGEVEGIQTRLPALQRLFDLLSRAQLGLELVESANHTHAELIPQLGASRAWFSMRLGRYREAVTHATSALSTLPNTCAAKETCLNALGAAYDALGRFAEARRAFETSLRLARADSGEAATAMTNLAVNAINRGAYGEAQTYLAEARTIFEVQAKRVKLVWCLYVGGWLALETGDRPRARVALEGALAEAQTLDLKHWALLCGLKRAHLFALEGHTERAKRLGYGVLKEVQADKSGKEARTHAALGAICLKEEPRAALTHYSASLRLLRSTQSEPLMLQSLTGILSALGELEPLVVYDSLYTFCASSVSKMFYVDQRTFRGLTLSPIDLAWQNLSTAEVASLVLSVLEEAGVLKHPRETI